MAKAMPWDEDWKVLRQLDKGGQGETVLVTGKNSGEAVLKKLRNQKGEQARRRMFQEVANLRVLHAAGCNVPAVIEDNTDSFEDGSVFLYFVMEYVAGETLAGTVDKRGPLGLDEAIAITINVAETIGKGIDNEIIHRDLKPENLLVRSVDPADVVVLDYGLSFNRANDQAVTRASESLDNDFLSLPERRVPGGNRRDPRSDVTYLAAIFWYCLSGERPVDLIDAEGRLPHRRALGVRECLGDEPRAADVEGVLDRGFKTFIEYRFSTTTELIERLRSIGEPAAKVAQVRPGDLAKEIGDRLLQTDRPTQLRRYAGKSKGLADALTKGVGGQQIAPFQHVVRGLADGKVKPPSRPENTEQINVPPCRIDVSYVGHPIAWMIGYGVFATDQECTIYRVTGRLWQRQARYRDDWTPIHTYDGLQEPDFAVVIHDAEECLNEAMRGIEEEVGRGVTGFTEEPLLDTALGR